MFRNIIVWEEFQLNVVFRQIKRKNLMKLMVSRNRLIFQRVVWTVKKGSARV